MLNNCFNLPMYAMQVKQTLVGRLRRLRSILLTDLLKGVTNHMTEIQKTVIAPGYICPSYLPYASDIFYHNKISYFLPTGFLPTELDAVYVFPEYCSKHNLKLPEIVWEMFNYYFKASEQALTAANILSPLKGEYVDFLIPIYARGIPPIKHCNNLLQHNLYLRDLFHLTNFDMSGIVNISSVSKYPKCI